MREQTKDRSEEAAERQKAAGFREEPGMPGPQASQQQAAAWAEWVRIVPRRMEKKDQKILPPERTESPGLRENPEEWMPPCFQGRSRKR